MYEYDPPQNKKERKSFQDGPRGVFRALRPYLVPFLFFFRDAIICPCSSSSWIVETAPPITSRMHQEPTRAEGKHFESRGTTEDGLGVCIYYDNIIIIIMKVGSSMMDRWRRRRMGTRPAYVIPHRGGAAGRYSMAKRLYLYGRFGLPGPLEVELLHMINPECTVGGESGQ